MTTHSIIFTICQQHKTALFTLTEGKSTIVLEANTALRRKFESITKSKKLDPFKVMRKLVEIYLRVRKSEQENPHKGLRALLRIWLAKATTGNLKGFETCGMGA